MTNTDCFDLSKGYSFEVSNRLGELNAVFRNEDLLPPDTVLELYINNELGRTNVRVPPDREIECKMTNSLEEIKISENSEVKTGKPVLKGLNRLEKTDIFYR